MISVRSLGFSSGGPMLAKIAARPSRAASTGSTVTVVGGDVAAGELEDVTKAVVVAMLGSVSGEPVAEAMTARMLASRRKRRTGMNRCSPGISLLGSEGSDVGAGGRGSISESGGGAGRTGAGKGSVSFGFMTARVGAAARNATTISLAVGR